jgi:CheY-like chemotaxis protein
MIEQITKQATQGQVTMTQNAIISNQAGQMTMQTFQIFLVDPSQLLREGLRRLLDDPSFSVCGEAATLSDALGKITQEGTPDLLLLDYTTDDKQRLDEIRALRQRMP